MIKIAVWGLFLVSSIILLIQLFRIQHLGRRLSALALNIVFAAFMLYVINLLSTYTHFTIPINFVTIAIVTLLGVPGVLLLIALKLVLL
ncbi:SigmaK-factor processing regulatory protein BofA [compost metagenome]